MDLAFLLAHATHVLQTELTAELAGLGITPRGNCVLAAALTGEKTQIQLADMCQLDKTTMVVTVDELERAGLAERRPSATDRRARVISVTAAGKRKLKQAGAVVAQVQDEVLAELPADERDVLLSALNSLVSDRLSTPMECGRAPRRRD